MGLMHALLDVFFVFFFFQAEDGIRDKLVTGVQTCALPIYMALPESATDLSYMVSYVLDIDSEEKQKLLEMDSTAERLRMLLAHLTDILHKLERQQTYKELMTRVRGNGDLGSPHKGN